MSWYLPDPRFEMPELFIPGKKPAGPVQVDWSNPITHKLRLCIIVQNNMLVDLVENTDFTVQSAITYKGGELKTHNDVANNQVNFAKPSGSWNQLSCHARLAFDVLNDDQYILTDDDGSPFFNVDTFSGSSKLRLRMVGGSNDYGNDETYWIEDNDYHNLACYWDNTANISGFWLDGIKVNDTNNNATEMDGSTWRLGCGYSQWDSEARWQHWYIWERVLQHAEAVSLNKDPYQILIPA